MSILETFVMKIEMKQRVQFAVVGLPGVIAKQCVESYPINLRVCTLIKRCRELCAIGDER